MSQRDNRKDVPATDDRVRTDGGKSAEDRRMPDEEFDKMKRNDAHRTKDEPWS